MKYLCRIIALFSAFSLLMFLFSFCSSSIITGEDVIPDISEIKAGYTYGIFTEKYNIEYVADLDGNIIMSADDAKELNELSKDYLSVKKILNDKSVASKADGKAISLPTAVQAVNQLKKLKTSNIGENTVAVSSTTASSVDTLTNYTSKIDVANVYPIEEDGFFLRLRYRWWWDYDPVNTWADKVLVGWSDNLDHLFDETLADGTLVQNRFNYYQTGYPLNEATGQYDTESPYKKTALALKGDSAITSVFIECGCEKKFDIKCNFTYNNQTYRAFRHSGSMYINVGRGTAEGFDRILHYYGTYMHKVLNLGEATATFIPGENGGFTLGATAEFLYDKAADAKGEIKYSEILDMMQ